MDNSQSEDFDQDKLVWAAQALRNKIRLQIYQQLASKNSCSFNELMHSTKVTQPKLAYHLQTLIKYNIITNFYDKREGVKDHSFYELSTFGRELFAGVGTPGRIISNPESNLPTTEHAQNPVNFRTLRRLKYKSNVNQPVRRTTKSIKSLENQDRKYFDPLLDCVIVKRSNSSSEFKKIDLPSFRKYYDSYKRPFKSKHYLK